MADAAEQATVISCVTAADRSKNPSTYSVNLILTSSTFFIDKKLKIYTKLEIELEIYKKSRT